jgi:hypothetical protein
VTHHGIGEDSPPIGIPLPSNPPSGSGVIDPTGPVLRISHDPVQILLEGLLALPDIVELSKSTPPVFCTEVRGKPGSQLCGITKMLLERTPFLCREIRTSVGKGHNALFSWMFTIHGTC